MNAILLWSVLLLQVQFQVQVNVPTIRFQAPPTLVEVQPGILVVNDYNEEVFFVDGQYWTRARDGRWYRTRDYRGGWVLVQQPTVPAVLVRSPPGRYKHHKDKPEKYRVVSADGTVTEVKVKEKHGVTEVKYKEKKDKGNGKGKGKWK